LPFEQEQYLHALRIAFASLRAIASETRQKAFETARGGAPLAQALR
jgi:hypothetical protein